MPVKTVSILSAVFASTVLRAASPDIVFEDFERGDYGNWTVEGTAFGKSPAHGTLPGQMAVSGYQGKGLVNSFAGGDASTGKLTSPEFSIERHYLSFLIGGGGFAGETEMRLLVDDKVVRTAVGPNTKPGGSEALAPSSWDVSEFAGRKARIQIIDEATGGWGHINVDQLVLTDTKPEPPGPASRELMADQPYLLFPVKKGAPKQRVTVAAQGKTVREFEIELSDAPEWYAHLDVTPWQGGNVTVHANKVPGGSKVLELVRPSKEIWGAEQLYHEALRPLIHFSPRRGWTNDPNGLVFADGEYHLYFQHNPYGTEWGNMHWGHAVSPDLVHWHELPIALYPPRYDDMAFSGSAVVDKDNTSGWKKGDNSLLVGAFTSTARGECIIYSNDRGRTWTEYEGNPVVKHSGRDPRLLWYAPTNQWVMALYDESDKKQWIAFYTSPDLKTWTYQSRIEGFFECPDLFELPLDGDATKKKWVLTAASSEYMVGSFDGRTFTPETPKLPGHRGNSFYAAQTYSHDPKGRVIQIGWERSASPGMPFNQAMSIPLELSLRTTPEGPRLAWKPAEEMEKRLAVYSTRPKDISLENERQTLGQKNDDADEPQALVFRTEIQCDPTTVVHFEVLGVPVVYDAGKHELTVNKHHVPAPLMDGKLKLALYADRTLYEVFVNDGLIYAPVNAIPKAEAKTIDAWAEGGAAKLENFRNERFQSSWTK